MYFILLLSDIFYCLIIIFYLTFLSIKIFLILIFYFTIFYFYTVQHHEQRWCWNGAIEDINIIIIISRDIKTCIFVNYIHYFKTDRFTIKKCIHFLGSL